jgi:hypothetical protein
VIDLLADSSKRKALGDAGRQLVESKGTWDEFVINFQLQLQSLLNTK